MAAASARSGYGRDVSQAARLASAPVKRPQMTAASGTHATAAPAGRPRRRNSRRPNELAGAVSLTDMETLRLQNQAERQYIDQGLGASPR